MRLRQLAISQSVVFFAPPEVHQSILNVCRKAPTDNIESHDVITWLLEQTCCNIEQLQPLYISQGLEYFRRQISAQENPDAATSKEQRKAYLQILEQPEQYSLERLYAPDQKTKAKPTDASKFPEIKDFVDELEVMKSSIVSTGDTVQALAHQEVEQEREVQIEVVRHESVTDAVSSWSPPVHRRMQAHSSAQILTSDLRVGNRTGSEEATPRSGTSTDPIAKRDKVVCRDG